MSIRILFNPHDIWIGTFWRRTRVIRDVEVVEVVENGMVGRKVVYGNILELYVCIIPTLPIRITLELRSSEVTT